MYQISLINYQFELLIINLTAQFKLIHILMQLVYLDMVIKKKEIIDKF